MDEVEAELRLGFVQKVFSIVSAQLFVTFGSILFFTYNASAKNFMQTPERSNALYGIANLGLIVSTVALVCCRDLTRKHPHNIILLGVYTFSQSILLSAISVSFDAATITMAVATTLSVTLLLAYFAKTTTIDFTGYGIYLYVTLWILLLFGFMSFFIQAPILHLVYTLAGTLLFSLYIVYDVQLIIGGNHKLQFSIDDYVMAALMLYIDIVQLFIFLLRLIRQSNNN